MKSEFVWEFSFQVNIYNPEHLLRDQIEKKSYLFRKELNKLNKIKLLALVSLIKLSYIIAKDTLITNFKDSV